MKTFGAGDPVNRTPHAHPHTRAKTHTHTPSHSCKNTKEEAFLNVVRLHHFNHNANPIVISILINYCKRAEDVDYKPNHTKH